MKKNLFDVPMDWSREEEHFDVLAIGPKSLQIKRIISQGHTTPPGEWYDQEDAEWVVLLQGESRVEWDDGTTTSLSAGDWIFIPPGRRHRVTATSVEPPCIWLAVHGELSNMAIPDGLGPISR